MTLLILLTKSSTFNPSMSKPKFQNFWVNLERIPSHGWTSSKGWMKAWVQTTVKNKLHTTTSHWPSGISLQIAQLECKATEKTWTRFKPMFKREFTSQTEDKFIISGLTSINMKPTENCSDCFSQIAQIITEYYDSYYATPE